MTRIAFLILINIGSLVARIFCPSIPSQCVCNDCSGKVVIKCNGVNFEELVEKIGAVPVDMLTVSNCSLPVIEVLPRGGLRSLEISDCGIRSANIKAFQQVKHTLEELTLVNNDFTDVPTFGKLPKLSSLDLSGNKISEVREESFKGLSALRLLFLKDNKICDFDREALEWTPLLELIDLSFNSLTEMPPIDLSNLRTIRLNNNQLNTIGSIPLWNVPSLKYLHLNSNRLTTVNGAELHVLEALELLYLDDNLLTKAPILRNFPNLIIVNLEGNNIEEIFPLNFSNLSRLGEMRLQSNKISHIARNSFDSINNIEFLGLTNNSLSSLDEGVLNGMENLLILTLRNNSITKVHPNALLPVPHLRTIDLAYNQLEMIESKTFLYPSLKYVDLSSNRLQGFEKNIFSNSINAIFVSGNPLECNEKFEWFLSFIAANKIHTHESRPRHFPEEKVVCFRRIQVQLDRTRPCPSCGIFPDPVNPREKELISRK